MSTVDTAGSIGLLNNKKVHIGAGDTGSVTVSGTYTHNNMHFSQHFTNANVAAQWLSLQPTASAEHVSQ
jgi:hypothetical protein